MAKRTSVLDEFKDIMGFTSTKLSESEQREQDARSEAVAMNTFRTKITSYRNSFNPYQKYAPGFDYINWKPYGTYRYEDPELNYTMTAKALAPYVHDVVVAATQGVKERQWEAMTSEGQLRIQERTSRGPSRMTSRTASRDNIMHDD